MGAEVERSAEVEVGTEGREQAAALAVTVRAVAAELPFGSEPTSFAATLEREAEQEGEPS